MIGRLHPGAVLALGDLQYESGTVAAFKAVFGATWGKYRSIMFPAVGNHEYLTKGGAGYFGYFGLPPYYSYTLGDWHMISLDSECSHVGGCQAGSAQERWLKADLAAHNTLCTLVYWHEPRFSSGEHGNATQMTTIWNDLVAANVDVVLSGHNHDYERFAPLGATGQLDPTGITEFVVGTGGKNHYAFTRAPLTGEVVRNDTAFGVMRMLLGPTGFSWRFYSAPGWTFSDSGSAACH
jgi:acid phosphatase type 7